MSDLYLIAHKVRGESAFDVAEQIECSVCNGVDCVGRRPEDARPSCDACDSEGYWWIIPTSGHRAYPYWHCHLDWLEVYHKALTKPMPTDLRDHYEITKTREPPSAGTKVTEIDLADLGL